LVRAGATYQREMAIIPKIVHQTAQSKDLAWEERMLTRRIAKILLG